MAFVSLPPLPQGGFVMVQNDGPLALGNVVAIRALDACEQGCLNAFRV